MMKTVWTLLLSCLILAAGAFASPSRADAEKRIALVIGNAAYQAGALATPANDAGLVAQTLQAAGFDVSGARDLDGESLRQAFRDFLDKAQASGPGTVAFIYLAGYGLQLEGENYFAPVDAKIATASDVAAEALRISDYTQRLAGLSLKASFVVLDAARANPFAASGPPLAGGLALADADPNMLIAFNAAPGTVAPTETGSYGAYARALTEMIREGGLSPSEVFDGVRLRVAEETQGAEVPWHASRISAPFVFFERSADAPPASLEVSRMAAMSSQPIRDLGAQDAYAAAIQRDTIRGYEDFLAAYPNDPMAGRIRALLAARREAITWRRTCRVNTADAYWSYLSRYPKGPHADDARWRLQALSAPVVPPASYTPVAYDVPPPPPAEIVYVDRPVLVLSNPALGFVPPPPILVLAPPPAYLTFPPPVVIAEPFVLPVPVFAPIPAYVNPPPYIAPPPNNAVFENIHNTTITNNITNIINQQGAPLPGGARVPSTAAAVVTGAAAGAIAAKIAMPSSIAKRAEVIRAQGLREGLPAQAVPGAALQPRPQPGAPGAAQIPPGHALPGAAQIPPGHALPNTEGKLPPGLEGKPGVPVHGAAQPPGAAQIPPGHALPNTEGKLPPGLEGKPGAPAHGAAKVPPGHSLPGVEGKPPAAHAPPGAGELAPLPGGHGGAKPGPARPAEGFSLHEQQPPRNTPAAQAPQIRRPGPPEAHAKPAGAEAAPPKAPKAEHPARPEQPPKEHQKPQTRLLAPAPGRGAHPPLQAFEPGRSPPRQALPPFRAAQGALQRRPPHQPFHPARAAQQAPHWGSPARVAFQPPHAMQPVQRQRPIQQQRGCGGPGLPPCR